MTPTTVVSMRAIRYLRKAHVEFDFFAGRSAAARFVVDRLTSAKSAEINPKCEITVDVHNRRTEPVVKVEYSERRIQATHFIPAQQAT